MSKHCGTTKLPVSAGSCCTYSLFIDYRCNKSSVPYWKHHSYMDGPCLRFSITARLALSLADALLTTHSGFFSMLDIWEASGTDRRASWLMSLTSSHIPLQHRFGSTKLHCCLRLIWGSSWRSPLNLLGTWKSRLKLWSVNWELQETKTDWKHFRLECGEMDVQEFRAEISANPAALQGYCKNSTSKAEHML